MISRYSARAACWRSSRIAWVTASASAWLVLGCVKGREPPERDGPPDIHDLAVDADLPLATDSRRDHPAPDLPQSCERWTRELPASARYLAVDDTAIYVSGSDGSRLALTKLGHCGQTIESAVHLDGGARAGGLATSGASQLLAGAWLPDGSSVLLRLDRASLAAVDTIDLPRAPTSLASELWDVAAGGAGAWTSGTLGAGTKDAKLWVVKEKGASTCPFLPMATSGRRIALHGDHVYLTGRDGGDAYVARYGVGDCSANPPCAACQPSWSARFRYNAHPTEARALVIVGGRAYVAGFVELDASDGQGMLAQLDLASGAVTNFFIWNASGEQDLFDDLASDGESLYVIGTKGLGADPTAAEAVVLKLSIDPIFIPLWVKTLPGKGQGGAIELIGETGPVVAGWSASGGFVRRCTAAGDCS